MKNKKFSKFELFCLTAGTIKAKIQNHTIGDSIISVDTATKNDTCNLLVNFDNGDHFSITQDCIYDIYCKSDGKLRDTIIAVIQMAEKQYGEIKDVSQKTSSDKRSVMDIRNIFPQVVPFNSDSLTNMIFMRLPIDPNLCITFRCYIARAPEKLISIPITKDIYNLYFSAYRLGEFLEHARNNMRQLFQFNIRRMDWELKIALIQYGLSGEEIHNYLSNCTKHHYLYCVTTDACLYGASVLLFPEILTQFSKSIGGSFFILPGSVNELYFCSAQAPKAPRTEDWQSTIKDSNQIFPEEYLSEHVFYFDSTTGQVCIYK